MNNTEAVENIAQVEKDWAEVEELVLTFQQQFEEGADEATISKSKAAGEELLRRFAPLFKRYYTLIKTCNIPKWCDKETIGFVSSFVNDEELRRSLKFSNNNPSAKNKKELFKKFKFVTDTYGTLPEEEIMTDLQMLFLIIAKRYKQMGRSFCGYVNNSFRFELYRHIKKHIKNPINIHYKIVEYGEYISSVKDDEQITYEDVYHFDELTPSANWISGKDCSEIFKTLTPIERKIIVKYYLEEWNDRQISEFFGMHINIVNQKRRKAVKKIAVASGRDISDIIRNRRSGKNAYIPS